MSPRKRCIKCDKRLKVNTPSKGWRCAACVRAYNLEYQRQNKEAIKRQRADAYLKNKIEIRAYVKKYNEENREKIQARDRARYAADPIGRNLKNKSNRYGLPVTDLTALIEKQKGLCHICGETNGDRALCIDHNHTTNKVRALLCARCNAGIGMFRESRDLLFKASEYLAEFEEEKVACQ